MPEFLKEHIRGENDLNKVRPTNIIGKIDPHSAIISDAHGVGVM